MTAYRTPSILPNAIREPLAPEDAERLIAECREIDEANAKDWATLQDRFKALKNDFRELFGYEQRFFTPANPIRVWMTKGPLEYHLHHHRRPWATLVQEAMANAQLRAEAARKTKVEQARKQHEALKPARAVLFLLKHGKVEGQDFTVENAVYTANQFVRESLIAEKMAEGGPFSFGGEDSCDGCDGWDGISRRCNCGNRRVDWEMSGDFEDFEQGNAYVTGEAY